MILSDILDTLRNAVSNDDQDSRRTCERRKMDSCIGIIDGKLYPIENWSNGGILLRGDDRTFAVNDIKNITMKFKIADNVIDVNHVGRILRKTHDRFVIQFSPLTQEVDKKFKEVISDYVTHEFVMSQQ